MKVKIGTTTYTKVKDIRFDPAIGLSGSQVPINEFEADIMTDDDIRAKWRLPAVLYDDNDTLWANFYLADIYRVDEFTIHVRASSPIGQTDRVIMPAKMYLNETVASALTAIFGSIPYGLDEIYQSGQEAIPAYTQLDGFAPEQSGRERLQWILLCIGAYVQDVFTDTIQIHELPVEHVLITLNHTYWKPKRKYSEPIGYIKFIQRDYMLRKPVDQEEYVETANGDIYTVVSRSEIVTRNPDVTNDVQSAVSFEDITMISIENYSVVAARVASEQFNRLEIEADVINNAEYKPGDRVYLYVDDATICEGIITKCNWTFGVQAKSSITLEQIEEVSGAKLTIIRRWGQNILETDELFLPVGMTHVISNSFLDLVHGGTRNVYRPSTETITVTVPSGGTTVYVDYDIELSFSLGGFLTMYGVDEITQSVSEGILTLEIT